jgi:lipopolysaccharide/colanic/teichoic acid biosynthesis glycosyltransferase
VTYCQEVTKRSFDLALSLIGVALLFLPMLVIAVLVKLTSRGGAFFVQKRVGRQGRCFPCIKFRTMYTDSERLGTVTTARDSRITPVGRWLRRWKLDELPQLWSVLVGHMSLVGPRPDVPGYADRLEGGQRQVLELRPGITGPATLYFRYEEELLAAVDDPKAFNDSTVFPKKVALNLAYLESWSLGRDIGCILVTLVPAANTFVQVLPEAPPREPHALRPTAAGQSLHPDPRP